ncbi:MAG: sigma 54-interacting transcriptional regulator, partial [Bradyrhizobium sp.]
MSSDGRLAEGFVHVDESQNLEHCRVTDLRDLDLQALRIQLGSVAIPGGLIGVSPPMRMVHELIRKATDRPFPVLILGETGTGKELVARYIHNAGLRRHAPFVAVD